MAEVTPPLFLNVDAVYGADDLGVPYRDVIGEGVLGYSDLRVSQRAAGSNMTVDVSAGACWIMGDTHATAQPRYRCRNDAVVNLAIGTAHATLPRIDMVVAEVLDATFTGASNLWRLRVVAGTAGGGATLDNRVGAAAVPDSAILLADVLVAAADTAIADAEIRDRRPYALPGVVPQPMAGPLDTVPFEPHPFMRRDKSGVTGTSDLWQSAALFYLPRRIVAATRIRWRYAYDTAMTGSYAIGIYDASGRKIVDAVAAFTGGSNTVQDRAETIAATTLEPGAYYVAFGLDFAAGGNAYFEAVIMNVLAASSGSGGPIRNVCLRSATGGVALPTTLLGLTDLGATTTGQAALPIPMIALSVG